MKQLMKEMCGQRAAACPSALNRLSLCNTGGAESVQLPRWHLLVAAPNDMYACLHLRSHQTRAVSNKHNTH